MSEEGEELRARTDKLEEDKRTLHYELAAAQARLQAGDGAADRSDASRRLAELSAEQETMKDQLTQAQGQTLLLENKVKIVERKLALADAENRYLRQDLAQALSGKWRERAGMPATQGLLALPANLPAAPAPAPAPAPAKGRADEVISGWPPRRAG